MTRHCRGSGPRRPKAKRTACADEVNGINMKRLQSTIAWQGMVRLHQLGEDRMAYLSRCQYPKKTGPVYYACASTGLLFDQHSGACRQSTRVSLLIETIAPVEYRTGMWQAWFTRTMAAERCRQLGKPGPKPGRKRAYDGLDADDELDNDDAALD